MVHIGKGYYAGNGLEFFGKSYEMILNQYVNTLSDYKDREYQIIYSLDRVNNVRIVPNNDLESQIIYKDLIVKKKDNLAQIWFEYNNDINAGLIANYCQPKLAELFITENRIFKQPSFSLTIYDKDCFIANHKDGEDNDGRRVCVVLLYLNKDWVRGDGGELVITDLDGNKLEITPEFGNFAILDFTNANLEHEVKPITNTNFDRKTLISFIYNAK